MANTPTIKDVAKLAGVSISTVSRVMNDSKPVSPESRRKVLDAIDKLDFKPNELARSLVMKRSNLIGVVVKDIGIPYMAGIIRGIEEIGKMYNFDILLSSTFGDEENELDTVQFMFTKQVDGVILMSENTTERVVDSIKEHRLPYIILDKFYTESKINTVDVDYNLAMEQGLNALMEEGHTSILLTLEGVSSRNSEAKHMAYKESMRKHNLPEFIEKVSGMEYEEYLKETDRIIERIQKEKITGVFCHDDEFAIALMGRLHDKGIRVPEDVSIVGFGNEVFSTMMRPQLSSVSVPYYDIGAIAMRKLIKHLRKEELMSDSTILQTKFMKRDSLGKV